MLSKRKTRLFRASPSYARHVQDELRWQSTCGSVFFPCYTAACNLWPPRGTLELLDIEKKGEKNGSFDFVRDSNLRSLGYELWTPNLWTLWLHFIYYHCLFFPLSIHKSAFTLSFLAILSFFLRYFLPMWKVRHLIIYSPLTNSLFVSFSACSCTKNAFLFHARSISHPFSLVYSSCLRLLLQV